MTIAAILAAIAIGSGSVEFTATATGVEKGATLEFLFVSRNSDRGYEAMFAIEDSVTELAGAIEKSGIARGGTIDVKACHLWPTGPELEISPSPARFVATEGLPSAKTVYTGGTRDEKGLPVAEHEMPGAVFAFYNCPQSLLQFADSCSQGDAYGKHTCAVALKKGERHKFTIRAIGPAAKKTTLRLTSTNLLESISRLREDAKGGDIEVKAVFDDEMSFAQAVQAAKALAVLDSRRVMLNGHDKDGFFYRAFLPLVKWRDRRNRMQQPFELYVTDDNSAKLLFIDEDWNIQGDDPKITERTIAFEDAKKHPTTDTCFLYCSPDTKVGTVRKWAGKMPATVVNWYIYEL